MIKNKIFAELHISIQKNTRYATYSIQKKQSKCKNMHWQEKKIAKTKKTKKIAYFLHSYPAVDFNRNFKYKLNF